MHRCKPRWINDCDTLIHKHTYGNNKPELHTKEYFVGFVTVKDRAGASRTNKLLCQLQMTLPVKHRYGRGYDNGGNMYVEKYCVQRRMLDTKL